MKIRRRLYRVTRPQLKYLSLLIVSMTLPTVIVSACLYYLFFRIIEESITAAEAVNQILLPAIARLNLIVVIALPGVFLFLLIWAIVLSHRFAGPLERLLKELNEIGAKEDFSRRLRVRKNDEIKSLVDSMNIILEKAQSKTK